ncbi:CoA ester lyase [Franzmannia qiaohouensis]|uniref:CoA ester lyase n=1 Tax=Franzmannia qiaohouensis TaxID=1329370 RepID=A0ABU1HJ62_9GAMM|nr:CoA ester lyase [Halomonas qiaohouensis]MDR5907525.1 CoA ester lyase [Halomonas qiaohouensis]
MRDISRDLPFWRSFLFVPVLNDKFIDGAPERGADNIQLDMEDAIPPSQKELARAKLGEVADRLSDKGCDVVVRINRPWRLAIPDIEASIRPAVLALTLPKVPNAEHVRAVAEIVDEVERERGMEPGHTDFVVMIETAEGLANINEIADAHPRVVGIIIGAEDLAVSMGMRPTHKSLMIPNMQAVTAARAAGCLPLGFVGSVAGYSDLKEYRETIKEARELGFVGGFAIHPDQVGILNEEFAPSADEVSHAKALIETFEQALEEGRGAISYQGKMVDLPVVEQARALLKTNSRIKERKS